MTLSSRRSVVRCAIYTRSPSAADILDPASPAHQRDAAAQYIREHAKEGWSLVPLRYDEETVSGNTLEHPALQRLLTDVERGLVNVIVIHSLDCISRHMPPLVAFAEHLAKHDVRLVAICQGFATLLIENMGQAALAAHQNDAAGKRAARILTRFIGRES